MGRWRWLWGVLAVALVAAGCGGDDGGSPGSAEGGDKPAAGGDEREPQSGGELVVLFQSERRAMDPVTSTPSGASTGLTDFAVYGALVGYDGAANEVRPILAESLETNDTFDVWTLRLRPGLKFTDDSAFDAESVKVNWERGKDPASRSSSFGVLQQVREMVVVDPQTLEIHLAEPNAVFNQTVSKYNINYIASAQAIRSGHDLANKPVGAGPFMLDSWIRDDRMVLVRNPGWFDAPRPYLDRIVVRIVNDENQRVDTFRTGDGNAVYTATGTQISDLKEKGYNYAGVPVAHGVGMITNATRPPFNDVSMRRFFAEVIDFQAMLESSDGAGAKAATHFTVDSSPWHSEATALPTYDPVHAKKLLDEYTAANGPLQLACMTTQASRNQAFCKFAQTAMQQLGVKVTVDTVDTPTLIQRAYSHEFDFGSWGFPTTYPDPGLFLGVHSSSSANPMGFVNSKVDSLFNTARGTGDATERVGIYKKIYELLAVELPFRPLEHSTVGYAFDDSVHDPGFYEDGVLRTDLIWVDR